MASYPDTSMKLQGRTGALGGNVLWTEEGDLAQPPEQSTYHVTPSDPAKWEDLMEKQKCHLRVGQVRLLLACIFAPLPHTGETKQKKAGHRKWCAFPSRQREACG